jgi:hypothetical protein
LTTIEGLISHCDADVTLTKEDGDSIWTILVGTFERVRTLNNRVGSKLQQVLMLLMIKSKIPDPIRDRLLTSHCLAETVLEGLNVRRNVVYEDLFLKRFYDQKFTSDLHSNVQEFVGKETTAESWNKYETE